MRRYALLAFLLAGQPSVSQSTSNPTPESILQNARAATVLILTGEGSGRLHSLGSGALVRADGVILTAFHVVKGQAEVQVRLQNGDIFDHVDLLGSDERRDVAAIKIPASGLKFLTPAPNAERTAGEPVYAVTNSSGLGWSATQGILSATRPADEIPGAGNGFRLLQFTAPVAPGSSGSALLDKSGNLIGIITSGLANAGFAVPVDSVFGLSDSGHKTTLGSGAALQMPAKKAEDLPQSSASLDNIKPNDLLRQAKTLYLHSKTSFLTIDTLDRALLLQKDWPELGLTIVTDARLADVLVEIDRPIFTYVHTYVLTDKRTSVLLGAGKVTAIDGTVASDGIAKQMVKLFRDSHASSKR